MLDNPSKQMVDVYNLNNEVYEEEWKEQSISIPAKGSIKMKRREAVSFLGSYPSDIEDGIARVKMLQIRRPGEAKPAGLAPELEQNEFVCHMDGKIFESNSQLQAHLINIGAVAVKTEKVTCPLCDVECDSTDVLLKHLEIHKESKSTKKGK